MQDFVRAGLPKLLFIALYAWALIVVVNFITGRVMKIAETGRRVTGAPNWTLATVIRATGMVIVSILAFFQIIENALHLNLGPF